MSHIWINKWGGTLTSCLLNCLNLKNSFWQVWIETNPPSSQPDSRAALSGSTVPTLRWIFLHLSWRSLEATSLQGFLRAEETADIRGNKPSAVITSHLSSTERIIWTRFGLRGVTGRRCYGNKTKGVSYLALFAKALQAQARTDNEADATTWTRHEY